MRPFLILSVLPVLFLSPAASPAQTRSTEDLLGSWEWISTRLSADNIVTPETEGHTLALELTAEGVATWYASRRIPFVPNWRSE